MWKPQVTQVVLPLRKSSSQTTPSCLRVMGAKDVVLRATSKSIRDNPMQYRRIAEHLISGLSLLPASRHLLSAICHLPSVSHTAHLVLFLGKSGNCSALPVSSQSNNRPTRRSWHFNHLLALGLVGELHCIVNCLFCRGSETSQPPEAGTPSKKPI